ncbi:hypothetical protein pEaSNUABM14_00022 [Erwinia phage pEa_SNUABM_14]|nr:hypothetical protein pEaSNUABM13_00023 [Erwinia phage pEa_SNUABM_13]QYW03324.1 hypothetical protein pEaSNUABM34_00022 [Erwinia phage pEa_SNUABM_34]QYW03665.1 hypothetical protein pEaSNUABM45_00022 [Erwinia phage pEa_SNUABM_45]QYW04006.1 hypothetical protein pEaSNUABM46_00022 [Erwinia phage pEa_SNUABM_46]QYW04347.1 hypothetical protein pEaSNUABM14_00022 [Erwinia phage pEa_SNUABM_14]
MINKFVMKKTPTIEACQWNGENKEEIEAFLGDSGFVVGRYVQIGVLDKYQKPTIANVSVGNYVIKRDDGKFYAITAQDLFENYVLAD